MSFSECRTKTCHPIYFDMDVVTTSQQITFEWVLRFTRDVLLKCIHQCFSNLEEEYCPSNATGNKFMILKNFSHPILDKYQRVLKNNDIEIAGIEFLENNDRELCTFDINTNTNYNSVAESLGTLRGMRVIANFLNRELKKVN